MNYKPGDIVMKRNSKDRERYIYLGKVIEDDMSSVHILGAVHKEELGWFTAYPIKPVNGGYESHIPIYAWFMDLLEKIGT